MTGLSGAGRSVALNALEDLGIFCVDNLPLQLLPKLADLYHESGIHLQQIAVGIDVRIGALLDEITKSLQDLSRRGITYQVLFLEADDDALIHRFSETRRRHPLGTSLAGGIREERRRTKSLREIADRIINTTHTNPNELKGILSRAIRLPKTRKMTITVTSFGYKYGIPIDADIVLDVRFLPNPNYVRSMKKLTGLHHRVSKFVLSQRLTKKFLDTVKAMLDMTVPQYANEGKSYLTLAIGCTGGRHRSVALAEVLKKLFGDEEIPDKGGSSRHWSLERHMIGILILTHGAFGEDMLKTACGIMHESEKIGALNLSRRLDFPTLRKRVSDTITDLRADGGVLVLIDAYGGTSYNTTLPLMSTHPISLVTGVNLPMVLSALTNRHRMTLDALARKVSEDAKKTISVLSGNSVSAS